MGRNSPKLLFYLITGTSSNQLSNSCGISLRLSIVKNSVPHPGHNSPIAMCAASLSSWLQGASCTMPSGGSLPLSCVSNGGHLDRSQESWLNGSPASINSLSPSPSTGAPYPTNSSRKSVSLLVMQGVDPSAEQLSQYGEIFILDNVANMSCSKCRAKPYLVCTSRSNLRQLPRQRRLMRDISTFEQFSPLMWTGMADSTAVKLGSGSGSMSQKHE